MAIAVHPPGTAASTGTEAERQIRVGTASWTDKTLIACGRFYPKGATSAEARLRHYASLFPIVEVDSSYYAMPVAATAQLWAERTPAGFAMNVKAFRLFTGTRRSPASCRPTCAAPSTSATRRVLLRRRRRRAGARVLAALSRSAAAAARRRQARPGPLPIPALAHVRRRRPRPRRPAPSRWPASTSRPSSAHQSWFARAGAAATPAFLRELAMAHTVVDGPQGFANSVPALWQATHPRFALVRLHGRNARTWNVRGATSASDRFNYDYPGASCAIWRRASSGSRSRRCRRTSPSTTTWKTRASATRAR